MMMAAHKHQPEKQHTDITIHIHVGTSSVEANVLQEAKS